MAIVAGSPEDSEMMYRIHSEDEDELMPRRGRSVACEEHRSEVRVTARGMTLLLLPVAPSKH